MKPVRGDTRQGRDDTIFESECRSVPQQMIGPANDEAAEAGDGAAEAGSGAAEAEEQRT